MGAKLGGCIGQVCKLLEHFLKWHGTYVRSGM
jgi:hypothetical protein